MTVRLGRRLGLNAGAIERLGLAGLLHDIGKCAIPESILAKPAVLSASERRVMDHHAALGGRIAALLGADAEVVYAVGTHHRTHPQFAAGAIF
ncbi:MAG: HD domain-containing protein, partial [Planctomycetes bacterium]|nr:HD domain-containing protein [Planctomycetota bacterium]